MPLIDEHGKEVRFDPYPVTPPQSVAKSLARLPLPTGGMTAGAETGAYLGALAPPPFDALTVPLGAAIGAGTANVAGNKLLPPELGGNPQESKLSGFLWGAVPEGALRGVAGVAEARALSKGAEAEHANLLEGLKSNAPAQEASDLATQLKRPNLRPAPTLTGEALTDKTFGLRDAVLGPIDRQRRALGEPIGQAYDQLKYNTTPIDTAEAQDLSAAAKNISDKMLAPFPKAKGLLSKVRNFAVAPPEGQIEQIVPEQFNPDMAEWLKSSGLMDEQIKQMAETAKAGKSAAPTLDELRELRQGVNGALRGAQGGDVHALLNLQQALDEHLMPHLPANIQGLRRSYAGFIQRYPWRDINRLRGLGTPSQVGDWAFGGTPERAHELALGSRGAEKTSLQNALIDRVLTKVDHNLPPEQQVAAAREALQPYMQNGTAKALFGPDAAQELTRAIYAPVYREKFIDMLKEPKAQSEFAKGWTDYVKGRGPKFRSAVEAGGERFINSLPATEQAMFRTPPVPGAELPVTGLGTQEAISQGLQPGKSTMGGYLQRRVQWQGPMTAGRLAMGGGAGVGYGVASIAALASMAAGSAGYRALLANGGARAAGKLFASRGARTSARLFAEMLASLGTQEAQSDDGR